MRALRKQWRISCNIGEAATMRLIRICIASVLHGKGIWQGLSSMRKEQLGSRVIFDGRKCCISNWAGGEAPTLCDGGGFYQEYCPREQIANVHNVKEYWHRFKFGYSFYITNWLDIDVQRRLDGGRSCSDLH